MPVITLLKEVSSRMSTLQHVFGHLAASALVTYITFSLISWYRLRQFKGPWLACISELWLGKAGMSGQLGELLDNVNKDYGKLLLHKGDSRFTHTKAISLGLDRTT